MVAKWATPSTSQSSQSHSSSVGGGGSPFPPLGFAASGLTTPTTHFHEPSTPTSSSSMSNNSGAGLSTGNGTVGLPPAPTKFDASQAQQRRLQDAYWSDDEEDMDCPLCLEEIDLSDANFKPCPCGYQICRFCWHHIKQNLNGRCPACRRKYSDQTVEFKAMTPEEIKRLTLAKKQKERERKELEAMNRKHLANMRVVQKNLVYVVGLNSRLAKEELIPTLRSNEYFGQYGRISKVLISKRTTASKLVMGTSESAIGVYVTYHRKEDAARAIVAVDGTTQKGPDGQTTVVRASYGTTKYCTTYLRNLPCSNPQCTYLHEPGEEADSFTKEDLSTLRHAAKDTEHKMKPIPGALPTTASSSSSVPARPAVTSVSSFSASSSGEAIAEASALPKTASWASGPGAQPVKPVVNGSSFLRDSDLPPLSAAASASATRKASAQAQRERAAANKAAAVAAAQAAQAALNPLAEEAGSSSLKPSPATPTGPAAPSTPTGPKARSLSSATPTAPASTSKSESIGAPPGISKLQAQQLASPSSPRVAAKAAVAPVNAPTGPAAVAKKASEREKQISLGPNGKVEVNDLESEKENVDVKPSQAEQKETGTSAPESKSSIIAGLPSAPPGLALPSAPPGLPAPGSTTASPAPVHSNLPNPRSGSTTSSSSSSAAGSASTYQPSSRAQALLDDMRSRRAAEYDSNGDHVRGSPFPELDWDNAFSSFGEGSDFCFNLPGANGADREGTSASSSQNQASGAFSPFGAPPGILSSNSSYSGTPPPGLGGPASVASSSNSSAPFSYSGSFSPFGAGVDDSFSSATSERTASPFKAIDEMRRTLSEERASNSADEDGSTGGSAGNLGSSSMNGDDASKRGSRFGFAKRKESESTSANASPFMKHRAELLNSVVLGMSSESERGLGMDQDALASSINVSGILGNVFDEEPNSNTSFNVQYSSGDERDGGSKGHSARDSMQQSSTQSQNQYRASNAQAQHLQNMQYPSGVGSQGQGQGTPSSPVQHLQHGSSNSHSLQHSHSHSHQLSQHQPHSPYPSAATPPPGIGIRSSMGAPPGIGMGSGGNGSSGMGMNGMPPGINLRGNGGSMAAQVQAQQAAAAYRGGGGIGSGSGGGGAQDPLLAQIMAAAGARRAVVGGYGQQGGVGRDPYASPAANGNEQLPFFDPAIVHSMSRPQQAAAQAHAARYGGGYDSSAGAGGIGGGSSFSPFDSSITPQQQGGHHQNDYHHQQHQQAHPHSNQQQQQQQQAYDRYAQAQRGYY